MNARFDICILGAGLAGSALASSLAARGLDVAIFETGVCSGRGASAYSGGILRAFDEDPAQSELALRGVLDWLETPFPVDLIRPCGVFNVIAPSSADRAAELIRDISSKAYPISLLSARDARTMAPELDLGDDQTLVVFEPLGGVLDVKLAARLMLRSARESGTTVLEHATITGLQKTDRAIRLTGSGFEVECRVLVVAAGPWSSHWLPDAGLTAKRVQLSVFRMPGIDRCVVDQVRGGYVVPGQSGLIAVGSFDPPTVDDPDAPMPPCGERHRRHLDLLVQLTGRPPVELGAIVGLDAYTPHLLPRMGFEDPARAVYAFTGFSGRGAKYLPHLAKQAANELAEVIAWHAAR